MNKAQLIQERTKNKRLLEPSSWKNINRIEIDIGNTIKHELAKFICFILLRNGVSAEDLPEIIRSAELGVECENNMFSFHNILLDLNNRGLKFKKEWQRPVIVTEARFLNGRRADLFKEDTNEKVEIETDHKIKKKDSITVYI